MCSLQSVECSLCSNLLLSSSLILKCPQNADIAPSRPICAVQLTRLTSCCCKVRLGAAVSEQFYDYERVHEHSIGLIHNTGISASLAIPILFQYLPWTTSVVIINHILNTVYNQLKCTQLFIIEMQTMSKPQTIFNKQPTSALSICSFL